MRSVAINRTIKIIINEKKKHQQQQQQHINKIHESMQIIQ